MNKIVSMLVMSICFSNYVNATNKFEYNAYLQNKQITVDIDDLTTNLYLLKTATTKECKQYIHTVPPKPLWNNITPTLKLVNNLYNRDIIPKHTIISGYRDPKSNICTKGATHSKHIHNNAIDILISNNDIKYIKTVCTFWKKQGSKYNMGLGTYKQNFQGQKYTILHIDTSSYRTWGNNYKSNTSLCL